MASDLIVHIDTFGLTLYRRTPKRLERLLICSNRADAPFQLADFFKKYGSKPITAVIDVAEETLSMQMLPYLSKRDLDALIQRKIRQLYPNKKFVHTAVRRREKTARRDARVLFAVLTAEDIPGFWLNILFELQIPVAAVQSLPLLSEKAAATLSGGNDKLLIGIDSTGTGFLLRQIYYRQGELVLSRVLPYAEVDTDRFLSNLIEEIDRTRRFLSRQFQLSAQETLSAHIVCSSEPVRSGLEKIDLTPVAVRAQCYIANDYARASGIELPENSGLAQWLIQQARKMTSHYREPESRFYYRHHVLKKTLNGLSAALLAVTLGYAAVTAFEYQWLNDEIEQLQSRHNSFMQQLRTMPPAPEAHGFDAMKMQEWLEIRDTLVRNTVMPEKLLEPIGSTLSLFPQIALISLEWVQATDDTDEISENPEEFQYQENSGPKVVLSLTAKIEPFDGNYRAALRLINRFMEQMKVSPAIAQVIAEKLPVDLGATREITGSANTKDLPGEFALKIIWRPS